jgi:hypothetical protein
MEDTVGHHHRCRGSALGTEKMITAQLSGALASVLLLMTPAFAQKLEQCYALKDQRDSLGTKAMVEEIALAKVYRQRICPAMSQAADAANANDKDYTPINYEALIACRGKAERLLEQENKVLYRNSSGFGFYTSKGAELARQADLIVGQIHREGCFSEKP